MLVNVQEIPVVECLQAQIGELQIAIGFERCAKTPQVELQQPLVDQTRFDTAPYKRGEVIGVAGCHVGVRDFLAEGLVNNAAAAAARPGVRYDYEPLLRPHAALVQFADLAICHMETPIGPPGAKVGFVGKGAYGTNLIAAAWETPFDLKRVGFDRCSTASNTRRS